MMAGLNEFFVVTFENSTVYFGLLVVLAMTVVGVALGTATEVVLRLLGFKGELLKH